MISPSAAQRDIAVAARWHYIQEQQHTNQYGYALFEHNGAAHSPPSPLYMRLPVTHYSHPTLLVAGKRSI
jgi:hypothetical protein